MKAIFVLIFIFFYKSQAVLANNPDETILKIEKETQVLRLSVIEATPSGCGGLIKMNYEVSGDGKKPVLRVILAEDPLKTLVKKLGPSIWGFCKVQIEELLLKPSAIRTPVCMAEIAKSGTLLIDARSLANYEVKLDFTELNSKYKLKPVIAEQLK